MHDLVGDHSSKGPDKTTTVSSCFRKRWDHANKRTVPFQEQSCLIHSPVSGVQQYTASGKRREAHGELIDNHTDLLQLEYQYSRMTIFPPSCFLKSEFPITALLVSDQAHHRPNATRERATDY
jgi:hypothetical protein